MTADADITRVGTRALRSDLATHVQRAAAGQRLVVTAGGRPVAVLGPLGADGEAAGTLDALVAAGQLLPPRRRGDSRPAEPVAVWSGVRLDRALREVRG